MSPCLTIKPVSLMMCSQLSWRQFGSPNANFGLSCIFSSPFCSASNISLGKTVSTIRLNTISLTISSFPENEFSSRFAFAFSSDVLLIILSLRNSNILELL